MAKAELIQKYFPTLTETQLQQFEQLDALYREWNEKINVISRKDIDNLYEHHVLHSLAIAKIINFRPGTQILDFGTGGGFPGVPLSIIFPECQFKLIDGTGKKIRQTSAQRPTQRHHLFEGWRSANRDTSIPPYCRTDRHQRLLQ